MLVLVVFMMLNYMCGKALMLLCVVQVGTSIDSIELSLP